jgi:transketolase
MGGSMTGSDIRKIVLEQSYKHRIGHIGSSLSIADIIAEIYNLKQKGDIFILSKGHAALAQYAAMSLCGEMNIDEFLDRYGIHPHKSDVIPFMTGSLGMGLPYGIGVALSRRIKREHGRVFVVMSDAECNEGVIWESLFFLNVQDLDNITVIIDDNGQQAFGKNVLGQDLFKTISTISRDCVVINGHRPEELKESLSSASVVIAKTTFGYPISFMQNEIKWHYLPMTEEQYQQARLEL